MKINRVKALIDGANKIYIASHINPDGDNLGSLMALYLALKKENKEVFAIEDDEIPVAQAFLPGIDEMVHSSSLNDAADLFIAVDCADKERLGENPGKLFDKAKNTLNIDHHRTNTMYADINIVDSKAPAAGEIVYNLLKKLDIEIDKDIATSIYEAISSDTGSFKYDSVRKATFLAAADLMDYGVEPGEIAVNLYQNRSLPKTKLLIKAMNTLELYEDGKIGLVIVSDDDIEKLGAKKSDSDGIVEFVRDISTVELAIFLKDKGDSVKLSLRSKKYIDATKITDKFGGGGHIRAAGATINLKIDEAKEKVLKYAIEEFK